MIQIAFTIPFQERVVMKVNELEIMIEIEIWKTSEKILAL